MKGILIIRMQIRMIGKGFKASESKFERFQTDLKHWNTNSNHSKVIHALMQILIILKGFEAFETFVSDSKKSNANSND